MLLVETHGLSLWPNLLRRVAVVLMATLLAGVAEQCTDRLIGRAFRHLDETQITWHVPALGQAASLLTYAGVVWLLLWTWHRQILAGRRPWWRRIRPIVFVVPFFLIFYFGVLWTARIMRGHVDFVPDVPLLPVWYFGKWYFVTWKFGWIYAVSEWLQMILVAAAWFWWCGVTFRNWKPLLAVAGGWAVLALCEIAARTLLFRFNYDLWPKVVLGIYTQVGIFLIVGFGVLTVRQLRQPQAIAGG